VNPALALEEYGKAVRELEDALGSAPSTRLEQAGCIQYFEFCFELAWKTIKAFAEPQGMSDIVSPRDCLKAAFALHWIDDEAVWLEMLESRNKMSHTYDSKSALVVYDRLGSFLPVLQSLTAQLESALSD
jgi:nucleotidyltransferase substrate binding protein (TIGR01987 family)